MFGPESSGKTTLAMHAIAEAQRQGGTAALIDAEHAFDPVYSKALHTLFFPILIAAAGSHAALSVRKGQDLHVHQCIHEVGQLLQAHQFMTANLCSSFQRADVDTDTLVIRVRSPSADVGHLGIRLQRAGVDIDNLIMCQPDSGEMALEVVDQLVRG